MEVPVCIWLCLWRLVSLGKFLCLSTSRLSTHSNLAFFWNIWRFSNHLCFYFNNNNRNQQFRVKYVAFPFIDFYGISAQNAILDPLDRHPLSLQSKYNSPAYLNLRVHTFNTQHHSQGFVPTDWHYLHRDRRKKYCHYNIPCLRAQLKFSDSTTGK